MRSTPARLAKNVSCRVSRPSETTASSIAPPRECKRPHRRGAHLGHDRDVIANAQRAHVGELAGRAVPTGVVAQQIADAREPELGERAPRCGRRVRV